VEPSDGVAKAKEYAARKYSSLRDDIQLKFNDELAQVRAGLAARGLANSGPMMKAAADNRTNLLKTLIQARVDALIDGFELYGVVISEEITSLIIREAEKLHSMVAAHAMQTVLGGLTCKSDRSIDLLSRAPVPIAAIRCQIEERRAKPKMAPQQPSVTNVYHISGDNSRVTHGADQSTNVIVTSSEQVFNVMREKIRASIPPGEQESIIARLGSLEQAQGTPSFATRYADFIAVAANHMTVIAPFIPALAELLKKCL
jgi:hypothetical protein